MLTDRVIILGGAGFLGTAILEQLSSCYQNLVCGDIRPSSLKYISHTEINLLDGHSLKEVLAGYDVVVNLVGQIAQPFSITLDLNTTGMFNLAHALTGSNARLIHISSVTVYGSADQCDETSPLNPETSYAVAKAAAERILSNGLDPDQLTIIRLSNLYGYGQLKGVVAYLLRSLKEDQKLFFNNAGNLIRNYLHKEDCVEIIEHFIGESTQSGIYNVVGPDQLSITDLVGVAESIFGVEYETQYEQVEPWENIHYLSDAKVRAVQDKPYNWNLEKFLSKRGKSGR